MRILVAVPTYENICPETFKSIYDLDKDGHQVDFEFVKGYDCPTARNNIAKKAIEGGYDFTKPYTYNTLPNNDRIVVKGGGFACAMINVSVFKLLPFPWFRYVTYEDGSSLSEDLFFCLRAAESGFVIEADTRVRCGHMARYFQW